MSKSRSGKTSATKNVTCSGQKVNNADIFPTESEKDADINDDPDKEVDDDLPIDRGWAWVILVACSVGLFIVVGPFKSFGVFFVNFQKQFKTSSSQTSLVFTLQNITFSVGAVLVMTLGGRISTRTLMIIGSVITTTVYIVSGFLPDIFYMYIVFGVCFGAGVPFISPPMIVQLNTYFKKYRSTANNLVNIGISIGGLVMAPFFTWLFQHYGYTGTMILISGLFLNLIVVALLMRELDSYRRRKRKQINIENGGCAQKEALLDFREDDSEINCNSSITKTNMNSNVSKLWLQRKEEIQRKRNCVSESAPGVAGLTHQHPFSSVDMTFAQRHDAQDNQKVYSSCISIQGLSLYQIVEDSQMEINRSKTWLNVIKETLNLKILGNKLFLYFLLCNAVLCPGNVLVFSFLIPHATDVGVELADAAWLVSASCTTDIVTRFPCGYFADSGVMCRSTIVAGSSAIIGVACCLVNFITIYPVLMMFSVLIGVLQSVYFCLLPVVILDILSQEDLKAAIGFTSLVQGCAVSVALPVAGKLRDVTDGYFVTYYFLGVMLCVGSVMMFCLPRVHKWTNNSVT